MPIFEFKCERCGHEFESLVFSSETRAPVCPSCGSSEAKKVFSVFSCGGIDKKISASCSSSHTGGG
ncbi:MAG: zinc ribbon domain-containing protein [Desulfomonile tiedjei]|nr:zinc ribbon domain-containing protein [Desulfomonile tiedjei]